MTFFGGAGILTKPFLTGEDTKNTPLHIAIEQGQINSLTILCEAADQTLIAVNG